MYVRVTHKERETEVNLCKYGEKAPRLKRHDAHAVPLARVKKNGRPQGHTQLLSSAGWGDQRGQQDTTRLQAGNEDTR